MIRVRASPAERPHASGYGGLAVMAASPGSEVIIDGGVAARTGSDGSALVPNVLAGQRKVRLRSVSKQTAVRFVTIVKGRTVVVSPETSGGAGDPQSTFAPAGTNPQGFPEFLRARDKAVMVRVPEGEFLMGNLETEGKPQPHQVSVSAFLMDKLPVTWGQFKRFSAATGTPLPPAPYWGIHDDHPVSFVRWDEARAYCEWAGARLPSEAEREKAARGTDGRKYPWGNEEPTPERGVFRRNWGYEGTDAVGIRPAGASPYGLLDTGGNVWEYCQDWYDPDYYKSSPPKDPMGPKTGRARVVRGGSWDSRPSVLSASSRNFAYVGYREGDFGFRCAADPPPNEKSDNAAQGSTK
jgi:formylglycine-generating enzyme required for sulfatase activity